MQSSLFLSIAFMTGLSGLASADTVSFATTIDTSSVTGTDGGIYLSFAPGLNADPASVSVSGFAPLAGLPGAPAFTDGGVTGSLDTNDLSFTNYLFQLNDYGENVTFGSTLSFEVTFQLPDMLTGNSGSEFDIQLTESDLATPILTSDPSGNIVEILYDQNGNFTENATSSYASVTAAGAAPEPGGILLPAVSLSCLLGAMRRRKRARSNDRV
jgi:hypothetical protein